MSETSNQPPRPNCPALLICQQTRVTPNRLIDILGMMNAFSITEFPADVTFAVHFALAEGQGDYRLALFLESPNFLEDAGGNRHLLWEGDASLRSPSVVHEHPLQVTARFFAPGQCRIALYANGGQWPASGAAAAVDTPRQRLNSLQCLAASTPRLRASP